MLSHSKVLYILKRHGIATGWTPTAWYSETGLPDETSTFYWEFGIQDGYPLMQLKDWLGY